jgi:hypothetical protein
MQVDTHMLQIMNKIFKEAQQSVLAKLKKNEDSIQINYLLSSLTACVGKKFFLNYILDNRCRCYVENIPVNYQLSKLCRVCINTKPSTLEQALRAYKSVGIYVEAECKKIVVDFALLAEFFTLVQKINYAEIALKIANNLDTTETEFLQIYMVAELLLKLGRLKKTDNCLFAALSIARALYLHGIEKYLATYTGAEITLEHIYILYTFSR